MCVTSQTMDQFLVPMISKINWNQLTNKDLVHSGDKTENIY